MNPSSTLMEVAPNPPLGTANPIPGWVMVKSGGEVEKEDEEEDEEDKEEEQKEIE